VTRRKPGSEDPYDDRARYPAGYASPESAASGIPAGPTGGTGAAAGRWMPAPDDYPGVGGLGADAERDRAAFAEQETRPLGAPAGLYGRAPLDEPVAHSGGERVLDEREQVLELREEELVADTALRQVGEAIVHTVAEPVPARLEVDAYREEVEVEHVPVGRYVSERAQPWEEGDALMVPVYEEQLVVVKRLLLREHLRIRRVRTAERQVYEDTVLRDRLVVEDPQGTGLVHERYDTDDAEDAEDAARYERDGRGAEEDAEDRVADGSDAPAEHRRGGFLENLVHKALQ
jgi:stress response protein YsnF